MAMQHGTKKSKLNVDEPKKDAKSQDNGKAPAKKTECPITHSYFEEHAQNIRITAEDGTVLNCKIKAGNEAFSTGSFGWNIHGKFTATVGDKEVKVQFTGNAIVVGSKEAAD